MKTTRLSTTKRKVNFSLDAPTLKQVSLVGDFNEWDPGKHKMKKALSGQWKKTVVLPPGTYEYKFFADGQWIVDPENKDSRYNKYGTLNSIVEVKSMNR
jgi:1,4-alpha-glucan branching enzyme